MRIEAESGGLLEADARKRTRFCCWPQSIGTQNGVIGVVASSGW